MFAVPLGTAQASQVPQLQATDGRYSSKMAVHWHSQVRRLLIDSHSGLATRGPGTQGIYEESAADRHTGMHQRSIGRRVYGELRVPLPRTSAPDHGFFCRLLPANRFLTCARSGPACSMFSTSGRTALKVLHIQAGPRLKTCTRSPLATALPGSSCADPQQHNSLSLCRGQAGQLKRLCGAAARVAADPDLQPCEQ